jgi:hypothetical protein
MWTGSGLLLAGDLKLLAAVRTLGKPSNLQEISGNIGNL